MTGSSPISIQAQCEPAPIVPAVIQIPKAMIPIEMENENASFMMASKACACRIDARPSASFGINPGAPLDLVIQPSKAAMPGLVTHLRSDTAALRTASREEKPVRGAIEPLVGTLRPVQVTDQFAGKAVNIDPF